jgi:hypothetical protein
VKARIKSGLCSSTNFAFPSFHDNDKAECRHSEVGAAFGRARVVVATSENEYGMGLDRVKKAVSETRNGFGAYY